MGCVQSLTGKIVIHGPQPSYTLEQDADGRYYIQFGDSCNVSEYWKGQTDTYVVDSPTGNRLVLIRICAMNDRPPFTLLYNHARDMDVGTTFNSAAKFVAETDCDTIVYDYATYGASVGHIDEAILKADSCAIMEFVTGELRVRPNGIVVLGESLGSVAALKQASEFRVAGVVILGGFEAIVRKVCGTLCHFPGWKCFDNRLLMQSVNRPLLVVHGRQDEQFSRRHPQELYAASPVKLELKRLEFLDNCTHMGITSHPDFWPIFREFIEDTLWL